MSVDRLNGIQQFSVVLIELSRYGAANVYMRAVVGVLRGYLYGVNVCTCMLAMWRKRADNWICLICIQRRIQDTKSGEWANADKLLVFVHSDISQL